MLGKNCADQTDDLLKNKKIENKKKRKKIKRVLQHKKLYTILFYIIYNNILIV